MNIFKMASKTKLNVQSFPRPPLLEKTPRHLQVKWNGELIADTKDAYWVLETHHPPSMYKQAESHSRQTPKTYSIDLTLYCYIAYYLPPSSLKVSLTQTPRKTWCEWKGRATYWALANPANPSQTVADRIWSYERPTPGFEPIKDYLSFYAGPWDCFVDGEKVEPQPGDFYGGWVTSDIGGIVKGKNGNWDPDV